MSTDRAEGDNGIGPFIDVKGLTRDRPWLLPSNRKLRHLQGISLRNLALNRPSTRPRGKTIDDESLPNAFKTPAKKLALQAQQLGHSKSSNDLRASPSVQPATLAAEANEEPKDTYKNLRPPMQKVRRRSTLNWTNAPPRVRQQKLEDVARGRLVDTWFSLHCDHVPEPVYISEIVEQSMNPSFRFFDLNTYGPWITRRDELTIKYWTRTDVNEYKLLLELRVHLRSLQFIGKSLESFHHPLPENCVLLHLSDGIYTSFTDLPLDEPVLSISAGPRSTQGVQPTSSFDALMRLSNLDDCIQDALSTREKLASQIEALLEEQRKDREIIDSASRAQDFLASTKSGTSTARKHIKAAQSRRSELQASLQARRDAIRSGSTAQGKAYAHLDSARSNLASHASLHNKTKVDIHGQINRICETLSRIYPVEPILKKPLAFTIRSLSLPNATSPSSDPITTAAALGYVSHAIHLLSLYLSIPLPYPLKPCGSISTVFDPISTSLHSVPSRTFPLYPKGAVTYRFEYGVFLLNSDIELLMSRQGIRVVDLRHTLPNLKYLLTVLTTSTEELLGRKEGKTDANIRSDEEDGSIAGSLEGRPVGSSRVLGHGKKPVSRIQSPLGRENGHLIERVS